MKEKIMKFGLPISYFMFLLISLMIKYNPGVEIGKNFIDFLKSMIIVLPCAFILIGLFEVWVKKETVEKYFGNSSGYHGYLWAILLSCTTVGGAYVSFPVAASLYNKGAKLSVVLTYIGAASLTRIPMTIFEAYFLGIKFSIIRLLVSLPLVIISSVAIGRYFTGKVTIKNT